MKPTSPTAVKGWCIANSFHPDRKLGQNFLIDGNIRDLIVASVGITEQASVLEIGPGLGALTEGLLYQGAQVVAVEKDRRLVEWLQAQYAQPSALKVIQGDALRLDLDQFLLEHNFVACVSNLPYSTGTRILLNLALHPYAPPLFVVMLQQEVAERCLAGPGSAERGQLGVWLQLDYAVSLVKEVAPACFWPRPEIRSAVMRLKRREERVTEAVREYYFKLSKHAFTQRRKQMGTIMRRAPDTLARSGSDVERIFAAAGVELAERPENLSNVAWLQLAKEYASRGYCNQGSGCNCEGKEGDDKKNQK